MGGKETLSQKLAAIGADAGRPPVKVLSDSLQRTGSSKATGEELGFSRGAVSSYLMRYGLPVAINQRLEETRKSAILVAAGQPGEDFPAVLRRLYVEERLSLGQIAGIVGTNRDRVAGWLRQLQVPVRSPSEKQPAADIEARAWSKLKAVLGEEELPETIAGLKKGDIVLRDLAREKGIKHFTLRCWLKTVGVSVPRKGGRWQESYVVGKLTAAFGSEYLAALRDRLAGGADIQYLAKKAGLNRQTLSGFLERHQITKPRTPVRQSPRAIPADPPADRRPVILRTRATVFDLVDPRDWQIAIPILSKLNQPGFSVDWVAAATNKQLKTKFRLTEPEILYMRGQLKSHGITS